MKFSIKKPGAIFWKCGLSQTQVEERLAACSFRGAVERDGEWVAVPMCELNSGERERIYAREIGDG